MLRRLHPSRSIALASALALALAMGCGGDDDDPGEADAGAREDAGSATRDGGGGGGADAGTAHDDGGSDDAGAGPTCAPPDHEGVVGTLVGGATLSFTQMPKATVIPGHVRIQADDLSITLRQWVVTVPNVVGVHRCGETDSIQVALIGVDGVVGDGGAATANATDGACTIVVAEAATAPGGAITGCFSARIVARSDAGTTDFDVIDGAFRARR